MNRTKGKEAMEKVKRNKIEEGNAYRGERVEMHNVPRRETPNCELDFGSFRIFIKFQQRGDSSFGSAEVARKVIAVSPTLSRSRGVHLKLARPISPMLIDSVTILLLSSQNRIFLPFLAKASTESY